MTAPHPWDVILARWTVPPARRRAFTAQLRARHAQSALPPTPTLRTTLLATVLATALTSGCTDPALRPRRLTAEGVSPPVWGVLERPTTPGPHPAVLLLHGSAGWRSGYAELARTYADSGFVALAIDYYAETGRRVAPEDGLAAWRTWQATVRQATAWLAAHPAVAGHPVALVGYSRGAFLAISVAGDLPGVGAVVDYYGGGSDDDPPAGQLAHYPPTLILHGDADQDVSVNLAHRLHDRLTNGGGTVEMHLYPGIGHAFNFPWKATYDSAASADAWRRTMDFLRRELGSP